jgi:hypothetical protein
VSDKQVSIGTEAPPQTVEINAEHYAALAQISNLCRKGYELTNLSAFGPGWHTTAVLTLPEPEPEPTPEEDEAEDEQSNKELKDD